MSISVRRSVVFESSDGKKGEVHFIVALGVGHVLCLLLLLDIDPEVFCCKASALGKRDSTQLHTFQYNLKTFQWLKS